MEMREIDKMSNTTYLPRRRTSAGFTLIEMLIVAPIVILVLGAVIVAIVQLTGQALAERTAAQMANDLQTSLDRIEQDVQRSGAFLATSSITITSPQGYDNGTQPFASVPTTTNPNSGYKLILNSFMTTKNPSDSTRELVYLPDQPNACASGDIEQNQASMANVIYFVSNDTLWRRTVMPADYLTDVCAGVVPWQRPSCAIGITGTLCVTQDEALIQGISANNFVIRYYEDAADTTELASALDTTDATRQGALDSATTIEVDISARIISSGRTVTQEGTVRASRVGALVKYTNP